MYTGHSITRVIKRKRQKKNRTEQQKNVNFSMTATVRVGHVYRPAIPEEGNQLSCFSALARAYSQLL